MSSCSAEKNLNYEEVTVNGVSCIVATSYWAYGIGMSCDWDN